MKSVLGYEGWGVISPPFERAVGDTESHLRQRAGGELEKRLGYF